MRQSKPRAPEGIALGDLSEADIRLSKKGALCTGDKYHECSVGLWLLLLKPQHEAWAQANAEQQLQELEAQLRLAQEE